MTETDNKTKNALQDKFRNLPEDLQDAIFSEDISTKVMAIGKKYGLNLDKIEELHTATTSVILGTLHPRNFTMELSKNLGIDDMSAKKIATEVNEQIFLPIRESLKKIHEVSEIKPVSPFEKKLEDKVFAPPKPLDLSKEVEEAKKENRYPDKADPYKEPPATQL